MELDPLHVRIEPLSPPLRHANLLIRHRLFGFGMDRVGRIVQWREGQGYALSDLSPRGRDDGFPHICTYQVVPVTDGRSRIVIGVRGKWTARRILRLVARAWIGSILVATVLMIKVQWLAAGAK